MMAAAQGNVRPLAVLLLLTSALAWLILWHWGHSPYLHYLHHAHLHAAPGGGGPVVAGLIFVGAWTVMTVAMMLPTSVPLVSLFSTLVRQRADRALLVALVLAGYLLAWAAFGVLAYAGAVMFREATARSEWLQHRGWVVAAGTLLLAGAYQLTDLKYRCLDKCRSPFSFVVEHWTGARNRRRALWLGAHHGLFCVGCCWTLMLLMFPLGAGNLGWMLLLGMVMAVEKNVSWGRKIGRPVGAALLALGLLVALRVV
jgi:predicted metal-binding membrane protein